MSKLGDLSYETPGGTTTIPVLEPGDVNYPAFRIGMPNNRVGCIPLADISEAATPHFRLHTPQGTKTPGALITFEDFEHGYPDPSNGEAWGPAPSAGRLVTSPALEAQHSLALDRWHALTRPDIATPRDGAEYLVRVRARAGVPTLLVNCQDPARPMRDCYAVHMNTRWDTWFGLKRYTNSNQTVLKTVYSFRNGEEIVTDRTYVLGLTLGASTLRARLYRLDGTVLADISATDTTYTGGSMGLYAGGESGVDYFDLLQKRQY